VGRRAPRDAGRSRGVGGGHRAGRGPRRRRGHRGCRGCWSGAI